MRHGPTPCLLVALTCALAQAGLTTPVDTTTLGQTAAENGRHPCRGATNSTWFSGGVAHLGAPNHRS